jgi:hypothetical protein
MNYKYTIEIETARELARSELLHATVALTTLVPISCVHITRSINQLKQKRRRENIEHLEHLFNELKNVIYHLKKDIEA